jgi:hypothetical protein
MGDVQEQDRDSGLVTWTSLRPAPGKRAVTTGETLEGEEVKATWMDRHGHVQHSTGEVVRTDRGELAIESWADGVRRQDTVTRDANVDVLPRR